MPLPDHRRPAVPRVVLDLEKLRHINCGLGRFSLHLAESLLAECGGRIDPVLLLPARGAWPFAGRGVPMIRARPWHKEQFRRVWRPLVRPLLPPPRYQLWHMTNQMSRYEPLDPRVPMLLTIHDLTFLHEAAAAADPVPIRRQLADIQRRVDRSLAIAVDTEFVAADVRRSLDVGSRPVHVIPLGLVTPRVAAERPRFLRDGRPFLLSVGNALPHKNLLVLLDLVEAMGDYRLVLAGTMATEYGAALRREVAIRGLQDRVVLPGEVSDADRQWLYEHCIAFLFPSRSEGFGLPVLEAMAAGRPVFVSRLTSLPEITGEHGFYFDSFEAAAMAAVLRAGLARAADEPQFLARAREHARRFTWAETARRYAELYVQLARA